MPCAVGEWDRLLELRPMELEQRKHCWINRGSGGSGCGHRVHHWQNTVSATGPSVHHRIRRVSPHITGPPVRPPVSEKKAAPAVGAAKIEVPPEGLEHSRFSSENVRSLESGGSKSGNKGTNTLTCGPNSVSADAELALVTAGWHSLPLPVRLGIVAMVKAATAAGGRMP